MFTSNTIITVISVFQQADMSKKKLYLSVYIFSLFIVLCLHVDSIAVCPVCTCAGI